MEAGIQGSVSGASQECCSAALGDHRLFIPKFLRWQLLPSDPLQPPSETDGVHGPGIGDRETILPGDTNTSLARHVEHDPSSDASISLGGNGEAQWASVVIDRATGVDACACGGLPKAAPETVWDGHVGAPAPRACTMSALSSMSDAEASISSALSSPSASLLPPSIRSSPELDSSHWVLARELARSRADSSENSPISSATIAQPACFPLWGLPAIATHLPLPCPRA
mmetsp:Transcript_94149/g.186651  ORF Transcript_94149/g.186651 Transcript_94149/m.186651 type:complete len:227 (-) Transcript_94149:74-754(-)